MIRFRVNVRVLAIDREDMPIFTAMMKALDIPFTISSNGTGMSIVGVYESDVARIQTEWESRGQTFIRT